jgi:hypothetical protein
VTTRRKTLTMLGAGVAWIPFAMRAQAVAAMA